MKMIQCIIRAHRFLEVQEALDAAGFFKLTLTEVSGCGLQKGATERYRGIEYTPLLPNVKLEMAVTDSQVDDVVRVITGAAQTGEIGDGKIFISNLTDAIRIRTQERGDGAV